MSLVTVLVPTFNHTDTLFYSIKSIQQQTLQDFEIFVVGDGAPARTNEIMTGMCKEDARIHYFPHPKGAGQGEQLRHEALLQARGKYVCYLCDDDLWLPQHLEIICGALEQADFAHSVHINVLSDHAIRAPGGSIEQAMLRERMLTEKWNLFGPTFAGHTLAAYHKLPYGWRPRPEGMFSDLFMWRQWLEQPWCRFRSEPVATALHFPSPRRKGWSLEQRLEELEYWWQKIQQPDFFHEMSREVMRHWQSQIISPIHLIPAIRALIKTGELSEAENLIRMVLAMNNNLPILHHLLSKVYLKSGRIQEALQSAQNSVELAPDQQHFRKHYSRLLQKTGN